MRETKQPSYTIFDICDYVIRSSHRNGLYINALKLHHILYFIQARFISELGAQCFAEPMVAAEFGAYNKDVLRAFFWYGSGMIPENYRLYYPLLDPEKEAHIEKCDAELIDDVLLMCAEHTASGLSSIVTRQEPWRRAYYSALKTITYKSMAEYFGEGG